MTIVLTFSALVGHGVFQLDQGILIYSQNLAWTSVVLFQLPLEQSLSWNDDRDCWSHLLTYHSLAWVLTMKHAPFERHCAISFGLSCLYHHICNHIVYRYGSKGELHSSDYFRSWILWLSMALLGQREVLSLQLPGKN